MVVKVRKAQRIKLKWFLLSELFFSKPIYKGKLKNWEAVIGLEIHTKIASNHASSLFELSPNTNISYFDLGFPGTLPRLNKECIQLGIITALALNCQISPNCYFDRKHYTYHDLPLGYQITQTQQPLAKNGLLKVNYLENYEEKNLEVRIKQLQLEQDSAKTIINENEPTFVDYNRAGIGLMEIVTMPDLRSGQEAAMTFKRIQHLLREIGTSDGNMEEGSMRCDANVSIREEESTDLGTRCEIKNIGSIKFLAAAIDSEIQRQMNILERDEKLLQETLRYDPKKDITYTSRTKEIAADYRSIREYDIPILSISDAWIQDLKVQLPETFESKKTRLMTKYHLLSKEALKLLNHSKAFELFERIVINRNPKVVYHWITEDLFGILKKTDSELDQCSMTDDQLGSIIDMVESQIISGLNAKEILRMILSKDEVGGTPYEIAKKKKLLITKIDEDQLGDMFDDLFLKYPEIVYKIQQGNHRAIGFFMGEIMKQTEGRANPLIASKVLKSKLNP